MKKRLTSTILCCVMLFTALTACVPNVKFSGTKVQIKVDKAVPQAVFASEEIIAALQENDIALTEDGAEWVISFDGIDESLGEQAYSVRVSGKYIAIVGGDTTGLMYGGLEVAEQINLYNGIEGVKNSTGTPYVEERGLKFNLPLDMRTPSYGDTGDSAQKNMENMWDMDFWKAQLDAMARCRYNVLSLWNLNPFPSMVKVPEYPDVALDDVWRSTVAFDDSYNHSATNFVREEHWENYEVIKKITIDEKIKFWREVMKYAHERGIKFYIITWNIYTYGEQGKYGITPEVTNESTVDYFRASVREMVKTYPDLDGLGVTAGENMDWAPGMETANERWLWETYGLGISDALLEEQDREFKLIHRLHLTEFDLVDSVWKDFPATLDYCENYAAAHMYSDVTPSMIDDTLSLLPKERLLWLTIRSDDFYYYRWGDPDYARGYIYGMPGRTQLRGYMMGGDGIVPGREYAMADENLQGQMSIDKNWFTYLLWGRLGYDPSITNRHFADILMDYYETVEREDVERLFQAISAAGKILPQVSRLYFQRGDAAWYPEASLSHPVSFGYLNIRRWMNSDDAMPGADVMSILQYVQAYIEGDGVVQTELQTPPEVIAALQEYGNTTVRLVEEITANGSVLDRKLLFYI